MIIILNITSIIINIITIYNTMIAIKFACLSELSKHIQLWPY